MIDGNKSKTRSLNIFVNFYSARHDEHASKSHLFILCYFHKLISNGKVVFDSLWIADGLDFENIIAYFMEWRRKESGIKDGRPECFVFNMNY